MKNYGQSMDVGGITDGATTSDQDHRELGQRLATKEEIRVAVRSLVSHYTRVKDDLRCEVERGRFDHDKVIGELVSQLSDNTLSSKDVTLGSIAKRVIKAVKGKVDGAEEEEAKVSGDGVATEKEIRGAVRFLVSHYILVKDGLKYKLERGELDYNKVVEKLVSQLNDGTLSPKDVTLGSIAKRVVEVVREGVTGVEEKEEIDQEVSGDDVATEKEIREVVKLLVSYYTAKGRTYTDKVIGELVSRLNDGTLSREDVAPGSVSKDIIHLVSKAGKLRKKELSLNSRHILNDSILKAGQQSSRDLMISCAIGVVALVATIPGLLSHYVMVMNKVSVAGDKLMVGGTVFTPGMAGWIVFVPMIAIFLLLVCVYVSRPSESILRQNQAVLDSGVLWGLDTRDFHVSRLKSESLKTEVPAAASPVVERKSEGGSLSSPFTTWDGLKSLMSLFSGSHNNVKKAKAAVVEGPVQDSSVCDADVESASPTVSAAVSGDHSQVGAVEVVEEEEPRPSSSVSDANVESASLFTSPVGSAVWV
ncbi:MAG: hypothetical protein ACTJLL_02480 [Anaplasma sp.]